MPIFTIPSTASFLDMLALGIMERYGSDPLTLSSLLILLPNRRAVRSLREAFLRLHEGRPMLLPVMRPIGDIDEEGMMLGEEGIKIPPAVSLIEQKLILTKLVHAWQENHTPDKPMAIDQAVYLANELASFLAEVESEQLSFDRLQELAPDMLAQHWQATLGFLQILSHYWPEILAEKGMVSPTQYRNLLLEKQAELWQQQPPAYPIIAAGITSAIPAVQALLKTVAMLPQGIVILPGLDMLMSAADWEQLDCYHPQYGLKHMLGYLGIERQEVQLWQKNSIVSLRTKLVLEIMRPAATSDQWCLQGPMLPEVLDGITRLDCITLQEEASVIALMMRECLEVPGKRAALVTNERGLAYRVVSMLRKWGIECNDSAGSPLADVPAALFLRLVSEMVAGGITPVQLLAVLKHPLAACGDKPVACRQYARMVELAVLRGVRTVPGFSGLQIDLAAKEEHQHLAKWLDKVEHCCRSFMELMETPRAPFSRLLRSHMQCAEALAETDEEEGAARLWAGDTGEQLSTYLEELLQRGDILGEIDTASYAGLFDALLVGQRYRPRFGQHPRLAILSPQEAQLQHVDLMILGGLNEGSWPEGIKANPWMSRSMREQFGLPSTEQRIGESAHNFTSFLYAKEVVLTRAEKVEGTPTIPSRWLLRLDAVLSPQGLQGKLYPTKPWLQWAKELEQPQQVVPLLPPAPVPPLQSRPRQLSVTQVETLMRNPYAVYAKHILGLKPLDGLDEEPGALQFGNFIHDAIKHFSDCYNTLSTGQHYKAFLECGHKSLEALATRPAVKGFWWPRFERLAHWFIEQEQQRRVLGGSIHAETEGKYLFESQAGTFTLTAKADRIEATEEGVVTIVDYKTGVPPTVKEVERGIAPQMTLEAVIARENGFSGIHCSTIEELAYWRLTGGEPEAKEHSVVKKNVEQVIAEAKAGLIALINRFDDTTTPYLAEPSPDNASKFNDYAHLARVKEWSQG